MLGQIIEMIASLAYGIPAKRKADLSPQKVHNWEIEEYHSNLPLA
jgi:hypothetical protein